MNAVTLEANIDYVLPTRSSQNEGMVRVKAGHDSVKIACRFLQCPQEYLHLGLWQPASTLRVSTNTTWFVFDTSTPGALHDLMFKVVFESCCRSDPSPKVGLLRGCSARRVSEGRLAYATEDKQQKDMPELRV